MYSVTRASRSDRWLASALVLLMVAGFGLYSTYQSALALWLSAASACSGCNPVTTLRPAKLVSIRDQEREVEDR